MLRYRERRDRGSAEMLIIDNGGSWRWYHDIASKHAFLNSSFHITLLDSYFKLVGGGRK